MGITKADIKAMYPNADSIEQEGSKQLFFAWINQDKALILSYETIIGASIRGKVYLTDVKYSPTTSRHCSHIARQTYSSWVLSADELQTKVNEVLS